MEGQESSIYKNLPSEMYAKFSGFTSIGCNYSLPGRRIKDQSPVTVHISLIRIHPPISAIA